MGREANCDCQWANQTAPCKVLLETHELIVRGEIRRRVLISSLTDVVVQGDQLRFRVEQEEVFLGLGSDLAQRWAKAIATPPPSLAAKLGISQTSRLLLIGELDAQELKIAIAEAGVTDGKDVNLILACVKTNADLNYVLDRYSAYVNNPPVWIIYPKGPNKTLGEPEIRDTLRREGFIDTKVASVSATLTALRFIKRS
jgi:hypothetical protein